MRLEQILFSQGFGSRRQCLALIAHGEVAVNGAVCLDPESLHDRKGLVLTVSGTDWPYKAVATLMLHKPTGTECSQRPGAWPSVYTLLPEPLRQRPRRGGQPGVQAIGRLDQDTTGLLLLTDDGALIHRLASPRTCVPKVYEVTTADPVGEREPRALLAGVAVEGESQALRAAACERTGSHGLRLVLTSGKYHQVKRMMGALGHRVVALHRSRVGQLDLPATLAPGDWCWLSEEELARACATELLTAEPAPACVSAPAD
jgi:16S rRNA pseudouridine516 synthase